MTLANSDWTGNAIAEYYGIKAQTVYPPAPASITAKPWDQRDHTAICVGRLGEEKRLGTIVDIMERVRRHDPDLRLRIVGVPYVGPGGAEGLAYAKWAEATHDWVDLHLDSSRPDLLEMMCRSSIGIHAKENEHFGISVAEMVRAGAAVLVHDSGGQVEIVGRDPCLTYSDAGDAAAKVIALLENQTLREDVLHSLERHSQPMTTDHFAAQMRSLVETAFQQKCAPK